MTHPPSQPREKLSPQDTDARRRSSADMPYHDDEYVAEQTGEERADADRRKQRDIPPGLSDRDADILRTVKRNASVLDKRFKFCGAQFGWAFIVAIVPVAGDALTPALSYFFVVHQARKAKIPQAITRRMILNLAISTTLGIVPGLGAILLAAYHANVRNARLLENVLAARGEHAGKAAQSANSDETKKDAAATITDDRDRDRDDDGPQGKAGEMSMSEQKPGAVRRTPDGEKEKEKSGTTDEEDEKDKNTTTAPPEPDSAEGDQPRLQYLRPARNTAEYVQHRDSRFIEDVS